MITDFKQYNLPKSWEEVTLKQFQELQRAYNDEKKEVSIVDLISIMANKPKSEVQQLPTSFAELIMNELGFIMEQPKQQKSVPYIIIDGKKYMVNYLEKLKTGECVDVNSVIKDDPKNYAAMLAILCRLEGETYDDDFIANKLEERTEMFLRQPITKILPIVAFFLELWLVSRKNSQLYTQIEEQLNSIQNSIKNSSNAGPFKKRYLIWRVNRLKKSLLSSNSTSQRHYSGLHTLLTKAKLKKMKTNGKRAFAKQNIKNK